MRGTQKIVLIIGRILLSFIFIFAAIHKIVDWNGSEEALINQMNQALDTYKNMDWLRDFVEHLIPWGSIMLLIALIFEIIGGLLIFFGIKVRLGAVLLLLFLIPATFFFHDFWTLAGDDRDLQMTFFLKNLSIFGALLIVLAFGSGPKKFEPTSLSEINLEE